MNSKGLTVVPGPAGYDHIRSLECLCGHVSIRDHQQMEKMGWVHTCPGCKVERIVERWSGPEDPKAA